MTDNDTAGTILAIEREAFRRWALGDLGGFLEISDPEVSYFDPFVEKRLDGLPALTALYNSFPDNVRIDSWEMIDPKVQVSGNAAVLTFGFESRGSLGVERWNTTEVYRCTEAGWRIVHTHWSFNRPQLAPPSEARP